MITESERQELLTIAREAIAGALHHRASSGKASYRGGLARPGGAFVTIRLHGELRGCIGFIESELPLGEVVAEVAVKAALEDPRFPPLSVQELDEVTLEVSVLSSLQLVTNTADIRVGEHGLLIELGRRRGLLLPQVAVEYGWDLQEFLENTARKAGLPSSAWEDPRAKLFMFSAEVCHEEHAL